MPTHSMATRASAKADTPQISTPQQQAKAAQKGTSLNEARTHLASEKCLSDETSITHPTLMQSLILIIKRYTKTSPPALIQMLQAFGMLLQESKEVFPEPPALDAITLKLGEVIKSSVQLGIMEISAMIQSSLAEQNKLQDTAVALDAMANLLNKVASDMSKSITVANTVTTQISETATMYKEAHLSTKARPLQATPCMATANFSPTDQELSLHIGLDRKARQILLDSATGEGPCYNIHEIKEKAEAVLTTIPSPPWEGTKIQEVMKLKNSSIIIQFKTKEAAEWIRIPTNEALFTKGFDPDSCIRDRVHPLMIPRIPITFDPDNLSHLRKIEEVNRMPVKSIKKARWIKPVYRHAPEQRFAHAIFSFSSAAEANKVLKDGIYVFSI
ncbi:hypothetical protein EDB89DRAFT_2076606 [Lactarius sanguifluus]|nr:hypothetical protein EDB89DRAFT_2076606 [Lactarius sanguifluus]